MVIYLATVNPSVSLRTGADPVSQGTPISKAQFMETMQRPVYQSVFDAEGYNRFVAEQQAKLQSNVEKQRQAREAQLKGEQAAREKKVQSRERRFAFFETDKFLAGRTQAVRGRVEQGRGQRLVEKANADVQQYVQRETQRVQAETEAAKGRFTKQVLVGYQSVAPEDPSLARFSSAQRLQLQADAAKYAASSQKEVAMLEAQTYSGVLKPGVTIEDVKASVAKAKQWSELSPIEKVVARGNVVSVIAQDAQKAAEINAKINQTIATYGLSPSISLSGQIDLDNLRSSRNLSTTTINEAKAKLEPLLEQQQKIDAKVQKVLDANKVPRSEITPIEFPVPEVKIAPPKEDWLGTYAFNLQEEQERLAREVSKKTLQYQATSFVQGAVGGVVGTGLLAQDVLFGGGQKTIKGIQTIVEDPAKFGRSIVSEATTEPARFGGELFGSYGVTKGGSIIAKTGTKALKATTFIGKTKVASTAIVEPKTLAGTEIFPTARPYVAGSAKTLLKEFKGGQYVSTLGQEGGYHATTGGLARKLVIGAGTSETPGLYIAPSVSKYFLRLVEKVKGYSLFPKNIFPKSPKIAYFETEVSRLPSAVRPAFGSGMKGLKAGNKFFGSFDQAGTAAKLVAKIYKTKQFKDIVSPKGKPGTAYISPAFEAGIKAEKEAIIQTGNLYKRAGLGTGWQKLTGFKEFTIINGEKVPILRYAYAGQASAKDLIGKTISGASELRSTTTKPIITPSRSGAVVSSSLGLGKTYSSSAPIKTSSSSLISSGSSSFTKISSGSPSVFLRVSGTTSIPSYLPPNISSYKKYYVPSSYTSSTPSKIAPPKYPTIKYPSYRTPPSKPPTYPPYRMPPSKPPTYPQYKFPPYNPPTYPPSRPPANPQRRSRNLLSRKPILKALKGFDVYVRKAGKAFLIGRNLPINKALSRGAGFTSRDISRSFAVKPSGYILDKDLPAPTYNLEKMFRKPMPGRQVSQEGYIFTEKTKYAIDELLEKETLKEKRKAKK